MTGIQDVTIRSSLNSGIVFSNLKFGNVSKRSKKNFPSDSVDISEMFSKEGYSFTHDRTVF